MNTIVFEKWKISMELLCVHYLAESSKAGVSIFCSGAVRLHIMSPSPQLGIDPLMFPTEYANKWTAEANNVKLLKQNILISSNRMKQLEVWTGIQDEEAIQNEKMRVIST